MIYLLGNCLQLQALAESTYTHTPPPATRTVMGLLLSVYMALSAKWRILVAFLFLSQYFSHPCLMQLEKVPFWLFPNRAC